MISGLERYFQIARCFRDEDLRADRQPEFTQVDLEMTFPQQETVFRVVESFLAAAFAAAGIVLPTPFPQITYDESVRRFGSDKPDMRLPELVGVANAFAAAELESLGIDAALPVVAVRVAKVGELSRKEREENRPLFDTSKGAKLIDDLKRLEKSFPAAVATIRERTQAAPEDLVVMVAGDAAARIEASDTKIAGRLSEREIAVYSAAGILRTELSRKYAARHGAFAVTERVVERAEKQQVPPLRSRCARTPVGMTTLFVVRRRSFRSGLRIFLCSNLIRNRSDGCRRIIRLLRRMRRIWSAFYPIRHRCGRGITIWR